MQASAHILAIATLFAGAVAAQVAPETTTAAPAAKTATTVKPSKSEKLCQASRRRVERQQEVIAEADARTAKERDARENCKTRRACDRLDRALKAAETRRQTHEKQLARFNAEAERACAVAPPG